MNSNQKELLNAINGTERMSGFDSYDNAEGDMSMFGDGQSYFDGDDMYFDGDAMSSADGGSRRIMSDPYVVSFQNTDVVPHTAILFGYNDYGTDPNFGNDPSVNVVNVQGGTYGRLIAQSNNKQFKIGKWRFQCSTPAQLQVTVSINHVDANGKQYSSPMNLSILRDAYQQQSDIIDVTKMVTVDGNTFLSWNLINGVTLTVSMFPVELISAKARLNGGQALNNATAPRLSGKNVAPVIIQTTQDVKGIKG